MNTDTFYQIIEKAIRSFDTIVYFDKGTTENDVRLAIRWVMRDNPDIFWFVHQYSFDDKNCRLELTYQYSSNKVWQINKSIDDVVEYDFNIKHVRTLDIVSQIMYVYKWLLTYCNYNAYSAFNQTIDSVFVHRNSVCTGYAKAAQYLFKQLGIESRLVFGRLNNDSENGRHCWNIVNIDGKYYHFDVSLGDKSLVNILKRTGVSDIISFDDINYNFFSVSTETILQNRTIEDVDLLPLCDTDFDINVIRKLSDTHILQRKRNVGCLVASFGSSADVYLCSKDKHVVLKMFDDNAKCREEYRFMQRLEGCRHLLQLNEKYTDIKNNIVAVEQATSLINLYSSHYYKITSVSLLKMIISVAEAWQECFDRGVLYRDIHLGNVYLSCDGTYKLGDFGSCTDDFSKKEVVGSKWFMAPETSCEGVFDERSAIYSMTMVMSFVLNHLKPAENPSKTSNNEMVCAFIAKGSASNPNDRFASINDFKLSLLDLTNNWESDDIFNDDNKIRPGMFTGKEFKLCPNGHYYQGEKCPYCSDSSDIENYCISSRSVSTSTVFGDGHIDSVEGFCSTLLPAFDAKPVTFEAKPQPQPESNPPLQKESWWNKIFSKNEPQQVYSSVFAPAEVKRKSHLLVQIYLHLFEETELVKSLAKESQKNAERRSYIPLQCKLKKGDKVDLLLNVYGETLLMSEKKSLTWQGTFAKCDFDYYIKQDIDVYELSCVAVLTVNGIQVGEMRFITQIVEQPMDLHQNVIARQYNKIFISYAHQDESRVKFIAQAYEAQGVDYFFDRNYLRAGDVFPEVIKNYIDKADLFILCWSKNASQSEYVDKERKRALERAFPKIKPLELAPLSIYPISIEPRADLPADMKDIYNFDIV